MVIIQEYAQNKEKLRRCDAKCYNAKGKKCKCICGAINHGKGIDFAIQNALYTLNLLENFDGGNYYLLGTDIYFIVHAQLPQMYKFKLNTGFFYA